MMVLLNNIPLFFSPVEHKVIKLSFITINKDVGILSFSMSKKNCFSILRLFKQSNSLRMKAFVVIIIYIAWLSFSHRIRNNPCIEYNLFINKSYH